MSDANSALGGVPELLYLDLKALGLSSRGGAVRFFLLRTGVKYDEKLVSMSEWRGDLKAEVTQSVNPAGGLPVLTLNGQKFTEHHAILRYLSKRLGEYGADDLRDYHTDRIASAAVSWIDELIGGLFNPDAKTKYIGRREEFYKMFTRFVEMASGEQGHVVGAKGSFAEDILFSILWDDRKVFGADLAPKYPKLKDFFDAYQKQAGVSEWCASMSS